MGYYKKILAKKHLKASSFYAIKEKCPFCKSELVLKQGSGEPYKACSAFPSCHYVRPLSFLELRKLSNSTRYFIEPVK